MEQYPLLLETIFKIEGLICGRSIHASGIFVFANEYIDQNSLMKAPNGKLITAFEMNDSEMMGCLKIDCLTIAGADKIRKTLELLLKEKIITWQGTLRKTYDKYLHPNIIEYQNSTMWDLLCNGEIIDLFQFDSLVGKQAINKVQPRTLQEMMSVNALMRLMPEGNVENPIDRYVRFKNDKNQWDLEMIKCGLGKEEMQILKKYLSGSYGVCVEQEDLIELAMAEKVAGFSFPEANDFKSGVSKKKEDKIQKAKKLFYQKGFENSCREVFLDYIWNYCFKPQFGYSFSRNHDCPYSVIALQEMNLVYKYGQLFWNTACLTVNSSADEDNEDNKTTNYGKIAKAISEIQSNGVKVLLPDINKADFGFTPDLENNSIVFGLKGISNVGDEVAFSIIAKRPYTSLIDFIEKTVITKISCINLIKGGAFDNLENKERTKIMKDYLSYLSKKEYEPKSKLTLSHLDKINEFDLLNKDNEIYLRYYNFNKYITNKEFLKEKIKNKSYCIAKEKAFNFFEQHYIQKLKENIDYWYSDEGIVFCKSSYDKVYKKQMEWIINYINLPEVINAFNKKNYDNFIEENWNKYCLGSISSWEMDSLSYYYHEHELININKTKYNITDFNKISEQPVVEGSYKKKGKDYSKYRLYKIIGTVLDRDKTKHIVTLLTTDGVVDIKFYEGGFNWYNKQISKIENDVKTVLEKSWFKRGTKLMVCGIRRDNKFYPKKYYDSIYNHTVCLIEDIQGEELVLKLERE